MSTIEDRAGPSVGEIEIPARRLQRDPPAPQRSGVLLGCLLGVLLTIGLGAVAGIVLAFQTDAVAVWPFGDRGLTGTYVCKKCLYQAIEFRQGERAVIYSLGITFPTRYQRVDDRVYVATDKGDLAFVIVSSDELQGEGWAIGTYRKVSR